MQKIGKQIHITVTEEQDEEVGKIAKKQNCSKAQVYRNMVDVGLTLYSDFDKIGVVKLVDFMEKAGRISRRILTDKQQRLF